MELTTQFTCQCRPTFTYASKSAFCQHKKSQRHQLWEQKTKDMKVDLTKKDNEILTLNIN